MTELTATGISFSSAVTTIVSVDSSTQEVLFVGNSDIKVFVVSNQSNNRSLWIKPDDNTNLKQGILVNPGKFITFPVSTTLTVYGIMDAGASVDISIVEFS